jgi:hypothetical protein
MLVPKAPEPASRSARACADRLASLEAPPAPPPAADAAVAP